MRNFEYDYINDEKVYSLRITYGVHGPGEYEIYINGLPIDFYYGKMVAEIQWAVQAKDKGLPEPQK